MTPIEAYNSHKKNCRNRIDKNGNRIEMRLTFNEWWQIWLESGKFNERGRLKGQYCMSRINDEGHYEVGNVFIQTHSDNVKESNNRPQHKNKMKEIWNTTEFILKRNEAAHRPQVKAKRIETLKNTLQCQEVKEKISKVLKEAMNRPEVKTKLSIANSRPCTIDGITIYPSAKALKAALGKGKAGRRNPNFTYI